MTHLLYQKKLKLSYDESIVDIVQFGSSLYSEIPNDVDIAVIFKKVPLKKQLIEAQKIKKQLQKIVDIPIHVKPYDYYSFFDQGNFAQIAILAEGKSLLTGKDFAHIFSLEPKVHISYELDHLEKKDKVKFHYMLRGKAGKYGLLREYEGSLLQPGLIEIKPQHKHLFLTKMKAITEKVHATLLLKPILH